MIRLSRPKIVPKSLGNRAKCDTAELWKAHSSKKKAKLPIREATYRAKGVKTELQKAQNKKCAYCESWMTRSPLRVEHFRPKDGWKQNRKDTLRKPEYFWLAYDWKNLLLSCEMCNDAGHKGNLFPLANPAERATATSTDISREIPLLINPYDEDPDQHLEWSAEIPKALNGSAKGAATIEVFGLSTDDDLIDERRGFLERYVLDLEGVERGEVSGPTRTAVLKRLRRAITPEAPYSAMVRANLGNRIAALK